MKYLITAVFLCSVNFVAAQNVGIGTTTPTEKLQVIGNIKTDTVKINAVQLAPNVGAGKILTSDANGNGTWQINNAATKVLNGLTKTTDTVKLGGLLQENTLVRLNANTLNITDTGSVISIPVNQISFPLTTVLSNSVPTTQTFIVYNNANLSNIDIYLSALATNVIRLKLLDADSNLLALSVNTYAVTFNGWSTFNFGTTVLNAGQNYILSISGPGTADIFYDNSNPYNNGNSSIASSADIAFRVFTIDEKNILTIKAGKIGINNINPVAALDVNGTLKINDGTNGTGKVLTSDATGKGSWQTILPNNIGAWGTNGNSGNTAANFIGTADANDLIFKTNNTEKIRVTNLGNVGVGTNNPIMKMHIANTDSAVALLENTQPLNNNVSNALYFKTGSGTAPYTGSIKTIGEGITTARLGLFTAASASANQLQERLTITDNGNIGIGTTTPLMKLHIARADSSTALLENTQPLNTNVKTSLYFKTGTGLSTYTGAVKTIGQNAINARLGFFTGATGSPNQLLERMSISDIGNVGIGTTTPSAKLEVNGNTTISGNATVSGQTTLNGNETVNGNATVNGNITVVNGSVILPIQVVINNYTVVSSDYTIVADMQNDANKAVQIFLPTTAVTGRIVKIVAINMAQKSTNPNVGNAQYPYNGTVSIYNNTSSLVYPLQSLSSYSIIQLNVVSPAPNFIHYDDIEYEVTTSCTFQYAGSTAGWVVTDVKSEKYGGIFYIH